MLVLHDDVTRVRRDTRKHARPTGLTTISSQVAASYNHPRKTGTSATSIYSASHHRMQHNARHLDSVTAAINVQTRLYALIKTMLR